LTHDEAHKLLRKYYRILELAKEYQFRSTDIIIAVGQTHSTTSPQEREVVRRVSMLQDVQPIADAIGRLHEDYQRFIELRWSQEMSLRAVGRELKSNKDYMRNMELECLKAFIRTYESL
jgi:DNA-directed RNA polymerase specialized sigma subunit